MATGMRMRMVIRKRATTLLRLSLLLLLLRRLLGGRIPARIPSPTRARTRRRRQERAVVPAPARQCTGHCMPYTRLHTHTRTLPRRHRPLECGLPMVPPPLLQAALVRPVVRCLRMFCCGWAIWSVC
jgi:hypothetical protein